MRKLQKKQTAEHKNGVNNCNAQSFCTLTMTTHLNALHKSADNKTKLIVENIVNLLNILKAANGERSARHNDYLGQTEHTHSTAHILSALFNAVYSSFVSLI